MTTTHLVHFFLGGAQTYIVPNPGNFAGYHTLGPYAHLEGFTPIGVETVEEQNTGGKLSAQETALRESVIADLKRQRVEAARQAAAETQELAKPKAKKRAKQAYRAITQSGDMELRRRMAAIAAPFAPNLADSILPPEQAIKFDQMVQDTQALQDLFETYYAILTMDEEAAATAVVLLM